MPVEDKFRNDLLCKLTIDIGHLQYIIDRLFGLPLRRECPWHAVLFHHASIKLPLPSHMLNKF